MNIFNFTVTEIGFESKDECNAFTRESTDENKVKRMIYKGTNEQVKLKKCIASSLQQLLMLIESGKSICAEFKFNGELMPLSEKTLDNWISTNWIIFDIDEPGPYEKIMSIINEVKETEFGLPAIAYDSFSCYQPGNGLKCRLVYLLDVPCTNYIKFRCITNNAFNRFEEIVNKGHEKKLVCDRAMRSPIQLIHGTFKNGIKREGMLPYHPDGGVFNNYKEIDSSLFLTNLREFILEMNCGLSESHKWTERQKNDLLECIIELGIDMVELPEHLRKLFVEEDDVIRTKEIKWDTWVNRVCMDFNRTRHNLFKESECWRDICMKYERIKDNVKRDTEHLRTIIDINHYYKMFNTRKDLFVKKDGQHRRKWLYGRCKEYVFCLTYTNKEISPNELFFNVMCDVVKYCDNSDKGITGECVKKIVEDVYNSDFNELMSDKKFRESIEYGIIHI